MLQALTFTVPGEPQGKGRARISTAGRFARAYTPAKTVAYESLVAVVAQQAMGEQNPWDCACAVRLVAVFPVPASWSKKKQAQAMAGEIRPTKKPDADNVMKAIYDGMNGVVWKDDSQAVDNYVSKRYGAQPGVIVSVERL